MLFLRAIDLHCRPKTMNGQERLQASSTNLSHDEGPEETGPGTPSTTSLLSILNTLLFLHQDDQNHSNISGLLLNWDLTFYLLF